MEIQTWLSRHNKFISAENITILSVLLFIFYFLFFYFLIPLFYLLNTNCDSTFATLRLERSM